MKAFRKDLPNDPYLGIREELKCPKCGELFTKNRFRTKGGVCRWCYRQAYMSILRPKTQKPLTKEDYENLKWLASLGY